MLNKLIELSRFHKQLMLMTIDSAILVLILWISFSIRLGDWYVPLNNFIFWLFFISPVIGAIIFLYFGLYRSVTRYTNLDDLWIIVQAVSLYSLVWGIIFLAGHNFPRSVVLINWLLSLLVIVGLRLGARWLLSLSDQDSKRKRALIYGAGDAGMQLAGALDRSPEYRLVGFIDEAKGFQGTKIWGLDVYSADDIGTLIDKLKIEEVLLAIPTASRSRRFDIVTLLQTYSVNVRMLPSVADLAGGKVTSDDLQEVSIEDLLGRDAVFANKKLLSQNITGKIVMVTGAGGSIGSEICRQALSLEPKKLILYEMNELALYNIQREFFDNSTHHKDIFAVLGNVNNKSRLKKIFKHFEVDTVYHAAAYKHVPLVEFNNAEGVENNIFGTLNCAQAAIDSGVETFVLVSTDKAVRPTNTMGATKRCAELVLQALSEKQNHTKFTMVRFGNVLNSSGSVIPLFKKQIKEGGPLTVTDKRITRYFMTIFEAVELVIQAGAMGKGGDVFVLDMGEPISINALAKKMIRLSGLMVKDESNPDGDIEIKYIGLRPGEKLYEELLIGAKVSNTDNPLIMRAKEDIVSWKEIKPILDSLKKEVKNCDNEKIRNLLTLLVPDFKPQSEITDILYKKN